MRRTGLFLIELIIVILFFAVSCTVCVNIFAEAKMTSHRALLLDSAVAAAQNAAELFKISKGDIPAASEKLGAHLIGGSAAFDAGDGLTLVMSAADIEPGADYANLISLCNIVVTGPNGEAVFEMLAAALKSEPDGG